MKIQLESITPNVNSSFHLMYNPRLSDLFFWHFHPEYELVYIEGATGTRHVGDHISTYEGSDLVLIGGNIPHLNFDHGVKTNYKKVVVHIQPNFVKNIVKETPELNSISRMFEKSNHGLVFNSDIKKEIGQQLLQSEELNSFEKYLLLLQIFKTLAEQNDVFLLHDQPYKNKFSQKEQER